LTIATLVKSEVLFVPISGSDKHTFSTPYSGKFHAINGVQYDVSKYYVSSRLELSVTGLFLLDPREQLSITIPWNFDIGYYSELFQTDPVLQLGISIRKKSKNRSVTFGVTNLLTFGGHVRESPCVDRLSREFHCGTGLPWVDRPIPAKIM